ncbi:hypothetical protein KQX54_018105 [Cotesia glomerata]|uniref:Uncharacterized protein n=1 Tax=Cotesia glomerata TaxID=32391 RepID=A0AAV7ITC3_COTGL|nr:hypothetical protein KQX54_018105 [Cotesia glomerata]
MSTNVCNPTTTCGEVLFILILFITRSPSKSYSIRPEAPSSSTTSSFFCAGLKTPQIPLSFFTVSTVCVQVCSGVRNKPQVTRVPSTRESQTAKETHASVSDAVITPQFRKICCWESDRNRAMNSDVNSMPYLRRWLDSEDHRDEMKNERTPNCASSRPNLSARSAYHRPTITILMSQTVLEVSLQVVF